MAEINEAFNGNVQNKLVINNQDSIDCFFTQRKITKHIEYIDPKKMERKKKKEDVILNFIAINIPYYNLITSNQKVGIEMKVYGNTTLKYHGFHETYDGSFPSILLKLGDDKQLFIHIKFKEGGEEVVNKEYVSFIEVPKRNQTEPSISDMGSKVDI